MLPLRDRSLQCSAVHAAHDDFLVYLSGETRKGPPTSFVRRSSSDWSWLRRSPKEKKPAAIVVELVLGERVYVPVPNGVLKKIQNKLFTAHHSEVEPDILVMTKGLGNGMLVSSRQLMPRTN
jgi:acetylornithine/succinyldiaminopimelate/putrescine aminotransferase